MASYTGRLIFAVCIQGVCVEDGEHFDAQAAVEHAERLKREDVDELVTICVWDDDSPEAMRAEEVLGLLSESIDYEDDKGAIGYTMGVMDRIKAGEPVSVSYLERMRASVARSREGVTA
jgi:hypothetical protein